MVGSRHDTVATELVTRWPQSALCSAENLVSPGWVWRNTDPGARIWVAGGNLVPDADVTGVFLRRSSVYAEELMMVHPADRAFAAAEAHAFLTYILATTQAAVANPVIDGAFGEETVRPERLAAAASGLAIGVSSVRIASGTPRQGVSAAHMTEVVGEKTFGDAPLQVKRRSLRLAEALSMPWGIFYFDAKRQLMTATTAARPSDAAAAALGQLLGSRPTPDPLSASRSK